MHARALCAPLRRRPGDLAGGAGYVDQAHFGHEFRAFTGLTPTRYVDVRRRFLREHPGHTLDGWPLPMVSDDLHSMSKSPYLLRRLRRRKVLTNST